MPTLQKGTIPSNQSMTRFQNGFEIKRDNELNDKIQDWKDKGVFANFIMNLQDLDGKQTGFLEELWDVDSMRLKWKRIKAAK